SSRRRRSRVEPRAPADDAEDEGADDAGFAGEDERREKRLALDATQKMQRVLALVHVAPPPSAAFDPAAVGGGATFHPSARPMSIAAARDLPGRCIVRTCSEPSPVAKTTSSSIRRIVPGSPRSSLNLTSNSLMPSAVNNPGH